MDQNIVAVKTAGEWRSREELKKREVVGDAKLTLRSPCSNCVCTMFLSSFELGAQKSCNLLERLNGSNFILLFAEPTQHASQPRATFTQAKRSSRPMERHTPFPSLTLDLNQLLERHRHPNQQGWTQTIESRRAVVRRVSRALEEDLNQYDVVWRLIEAEQNIKSKRAQALCQNLVRSS
jgi:hypothetical protein